MTATLVTGIAELVTHDPSCDGPLGIVRDAAADDESLADGAASEGETEQEDS